MAWLKHALGRLSAELELALRFKRRYSQPTSGASCRQACCSASTLYLPASIQLTRCSGVLSAASRPVCRVRIEAAHLGPASRRTLQHLGHRGFLGQVLKAFAEIVPVS